MRNDFMVLSAAKRTADEENKQLKRDLLASQQQVAVLLSRVLGANAAVSPLPISAVAGLLAGLLGPLAGAVAAPIGPPAPMQGVTTGAFDPSCFTAHLMALRQAIPQQQQLLLQQQQLLSVGGSGGEAVATNEVRGRQCCSLEDETVCAESLGLWTRGLCGSAHPYRVGRVNLCHDASQRRSSACAVYCWRGLNSFPPPVLDSSPLGCRAL